MFVKFVDEKKREKSLFDRDIAQAIGMTPAAISKYRSRGKFPSERAFDKIMDFLEVDMRERNEMWNDIVSQKEKLQKEIIVDKKRTRGVHVLTDEFYQLERELIKDYEEIKNVPDDNKKLLRIKEIVGGAV